MNSDRIGALRELEAADPDDPDLPFMLGKALLDAGLAEAAAAKLERACAMNPDLAAVWRFRGEALRDAGRLPEAAAVWREGIAISERTGDLQAGKEMRALLKKYAPQA